MKQLSQGPTGKTILLVDDDPSFLRVLSRAMGRRGYTVWPEETAAGALAALGHVEPDFAVVDLHLGGDSGLDVLEALRQRFPDTVSVVLSSYVTPTAAVSAVKLGAVDCLAKPVDMEQLEYALSSRSDVAAALPERVMTPSEVRFNHVLAHWEENDRNTMATAKVLGMHRRTLQRILKRGGVGRDEDEPLSSPSRFTKLRRMYRFWSRQLSA